MGFILKSLNLGIGIEVTTDTLSSPFLTSPIYLKFIPYSGNNLFFSGLLSCSMVTPIRKISKIILPLNVDLLSKNYLRFSNIPFIQFILVVSCCLWNFQWQCVYSELGFRVLISSMRGGDSIYFGI